MIAKVGGSVVLYVRMDKSEHLYLTDYQITERDGDFLLVFRQRNPGYFFESSVEADNVLRRNL
jgi:RNA binding exosome subunit